MAIRKIINKMIVMVVAAVMIFAGLSLEVFALENESVETYSSVEAGVYNADVTVTDVNTGTYGISKYYGGSAQYELASDGSASLKYTIPSGQSTGTFTKTYYDANIFYYRLSEADEWVEVLEEDMTYGSARATSVKFNLPDASVTEFYIKAQIQTRGSNLAAAKDHSVSDGIVSFNISQTATPVISAVDTLFFKSTTVSIDCGTSNATIYYTIDGVETEYTGPFVISETSTIHTRAVANGYLDSEATSMTITKSDVDGFGIYNTDYEAGEHAVTIAIKNASDASKDSSYAELINTDATLIVDDEGAGVLRIELQHGTMMSMDTYLENITYYDLDGVSQAVTTVEYFEEESYINSGKHASKVVEIPLLNKRESTVHMRAQAGTNSWYVNYHDFDLWILEFMDDSYVEPELEEQPEVEDTGFLFGSDEVSLNPGKYVIDAEFVKANDHNDLSMSNDAVYGDYILEVKNDGTTSISMNFGAMEYGGINSYVETVRYYTSDTVNPHYLVEAVVNSTTSANTPNNVTFAITNKALDGLYVNFDVLYIHTGLDAYLSFDYATATPYTGSTTGYYFGSDSVELAPGKYVIDAEFVKANDHNDLSMSNDAVYGDYILEVKNDGTTSISMNFGAMEYGGINSYVETVRYYTSDKVNANYLVEAVVNSTTSANTPNNVTFAITNKALDGLYVNFDVLYIHTGLDAYLSFDYTTATPLETVVYEVEVEETTYSKANGGNFTFRVLADFDSFVELRVNGQLLDTAMYSIREGSIIVEIYEEYLATLSTGSYDFDVYTTDGIATVSLDIVDDLGVNTNDYTNMYFYLNLSILSFIVMFAMNEDKLKLLKK